MSETTILGQTGIEVPTMGYGAWSWGDSSGYWGYGKEYNKGDNLGAYKELMQSGAVMLDTAEVYGFGQSERYIGDFMQGAGSQPFVASKFAPLPWRFSSDSVVDACKDSLSRLQLQQMGLYQIHWPGFLTQAFSNDEFLRGLAKCQTLGLTQAVGVSNFNERRLRRAVKILGESNVPLASNQVQYSLAYRLPERNGVLETCRELGVTLLAYSPIAQGLLTGKYRAGNLPTGPRGVLMSESRVREVQPLVALLEEIGQLNGGKTAAQVALNWTICKGTLPIPGVKNQSQVQEALGALGWRMTDDQVAALDDLSDQLGTLKDGAPFEDW